MASLYLSILLGFLVNVVVIIILGFRYKYLLLYFNEKVSVLHSIYAFCIAQNVNYLLPSNVGGVLAKSAVLKAISKVSIKDSLFLSIFEQIFDLLWQIALLGIALFFFRGLLFSQTTSSMIVLILTLAVIAFIVTLKADVLLRFLIKRVLPKKLEKKFPFESDVSSIKKRFLSCLKSSRFLCSLVFFIFLVILLSPLMLTFSLNAFDLHLPYGEVFLVYWVSLIIGRLSGIPGGFGSRDLTMYALLASYGVASAPLLKVIVAYRVITLVPNVVIGGSLILYYSGKYGFKIFSQKEA